MSSNLARQERSLSTPLTTAASPDLPELPPAATQEVASRISDLPQDEVHADPSEDVEVLQASIRAGSVAQIIVAVIAVDPSIDPETLRQLNKDLGQTIVMITHNPEAVTYFDRVVHMRDGVIVDGVPAD